MSQIQLSAEEEQTLTGNKQYAARLKRRQFESELKKIENAMLRILQKADIGRK